MENVLNEIYSKGQQEKIIYVLEHNDSIVVVMNGATIGKYTSCTYIKKSEKWNCSRRWHFNSITKVFDYLTMVESWGYKKPLWFKQ